MKNETQNADVVALRLVRTMIELGLENEGGDLSAAYNGALRGALKAADADHLVGVMAAHLMWALGRVNGDPLSILTELEELGTLTRLKMDDDGS